MIERLKAIHALSRRVNTDESIHREKLLRMMEHHIDEIRTLLLKDDPHAYVETGDLMILAMELLLEGSKDPKEMFDYCSGRFERKLHAILDEREHPASDQ